MRNVTLFFRFQFSIFNIISYLCTQKQTVNRLVAATKGRGKSGQHRASRFLTGSGPQGSVSAEENNRLLPEVRVRR